VATRQRHFNRIEQADRTDVKIAIWLYISLSTINTLGNDLFFEIHIYVPQINQGFIQVTNRFQEVFHGLISLKAFNATSLLNFDKDERAGATPVEHFFAKVERQNIRFRMGNF